MLKKESETQRDSNARKLHFFQIGGLLILTYYICVDVPAKFSCFPSMKRGRPLSISFHLCQRSVVLDIKGVSNVLVNFVINVMASKILKII